MINKRGQDKKQEIFSRNFLGKKAQGMSTSTIILLILGLVILVVLILGFTMGWNKVLPWVNSNNVDSVKTSCNIACSTGSEFGYCSDMKTVNDGTNDKFEATCYALANDATYTQRFYGIAQCPQVDCSATAAA